MMLKILFKGGGGINTHPEPAEVSLSKALNAGLLQVSGWPLMGACELLIIDIFSLLKELHYTNILFLPKNVFFARRSRFYCISV